MIFLGDVAIAPEDIIYHKGFLPVFSDKPLCINLEGALTYAKKSPKRGLVNTYKILEIFKDFNLSLVSIANNHISDQKNGILNTIKFFNQNKIKVSGGEISKSSKQNPVCIGDYQIFSYGWEVIGCKKSKINRPGIYNLNPYEIISQIKEFMLNNPKNKIIINFHWNYEFEKYPQPAHRKLAHKLIDLGVYSIVGHGPHVVGPIEVYKNKYIIYSLGNWAISRKRFYDGRLSYPSFCNYQIALEICPEEFIIHHCKFDFNTVNYIKSEKINSQKFSLNAEFQDFSDDEYLKWFRKRRIQKKLLPIYKDFSETNHNKLKDTYCYIRIFLIKILLFLKIKNFRK